jgi:hypothetical protein
MYIYNISTLYIYIDINIPWLTGKYVSQALPETVPLPVLHRFVCHLRDATLRTSPWTGRWVKGAMDLGRAPYVYIYMYILYNMIYIYMYISIYIISGGYRMGNVQQSMELMTRDLMLSSPQRDSPVD